MKRRVLALLIALLATQVGSLISPAYACGCGAMVPGGQSRIGVDRETSVVRWDGRTEQIVMRFTVGGDAQRAAWIMPVPGRATVELGDGNMFGELSEMTRPERRTRSYFWPRNGDWPFASKVGDSAGAAPGRTPSAVGVVGREQLGDFDVARLTATDPQALKNWLESNGFTLPDRLAAEVKPYVDQKWEYVAVRLAPRQEGKVLRGDLDPLKIRFESERLVYPMRLSRMAKTPQSLGLYVLADHRMEPASPIGGSAPKVTFAGTIHPKDGSLAELAGGEPVFLTAIDQEFPEPARIDADHELRATAQDTPYRRAVYRNELLTVWDGIPVWLLTVSGVLVALAASCFAVIRRRRGRRRPSPGQAA
ncbi:DUF2330 domain-containing protein [Streptomyces sp. NBC_01294]|uniref:DUF2330 domain-containing protein n=1 Tax=Streptomyces sp. NBC_01294 TaxID=2903815 RepID=UPI002DDAE105|nr:DUF2330 domain-containing protein [Streptomyces sp. NBC_01294]WRZ55474.1 DUF2330 domain-containing protein [Streptomyces sp. NBC_01294]WRZ61223.1 DUF2330 domain-containing protein [Streptomyces sp. NBC_01294]